jgi:Family of unknown function (DUF6069)
MAQSYQSGVAPQRPVVNAGRLWAGGLATALVAALIAIVGIVGARALFDVPILAPKGEGAWGDASTGWYAFGAALVSLVATGLMHLLLLYAPRPMSFFGWVVGLATVAAMVAPFAVDGTLASKLFTAGLNLVLGVAIGTLIAGTARTVVRTAVVRPAPGPYR